MISQLEVTKEGSGFNELGGLENMVDQLEEQNHIIEE
jgi:hypothetical protein